MKSSRIEKNLNHLLFMVAPHYTAVVVPR